MGLFKWLYPGLRMKRWILLCGMGMVLCSMGFVVSLLREQELFGSLFVVAGIFLVILSIRKIIKSIVTFLAPHHEGQVLNVMYHHGVLASGPRVVAIGGGTGLSVLLQGLKERTSNISAIVTVTDDGGSSGRLRTQFDVLPPGDIRNCLVALADSESMMQDLFQFRFSEKSSDFSGHSFGNLFILAMTKITGDFEKAIQESSRILNIRGRVIPSTLAKGTLVAEHADGKISEGETNISNYDSSIQKIYLKPENVMATEEALNAIRQADVIVLGPGSLFTSILPNLLIGDLLSEVVNARVPKVYVCNIMTQPRETSHLLSDYDHVKTLVDQTQSDVVTHCIVNTGRIPDSIVEAYKQDGAYPLKHEGEKLEALGYRVIEADLVKNVKYARHNSRKLAKIITELAVKK